jgi:hypothetical protein
MCVLIGERELEFLLEVTHDVYMTCEKSFRDGITES